MRQLIIKLQVNCGGLARLARLTLNYRIARDAS